MYYINKNYYFVSTSLLSNLLHFYATLLHTDIVNRVEYLRSKINLNVN